MVLVKCHKCGNEWDYTGGLCKPNCPSCRQPTWVDKKLKHKWKKKQ